MTPGGDLSAQPYRIIWYDGLAKSDFSEDGTLAELSFEVLKEGLHKIEIFIPDSNTFNKDFISVPIEVRNGLINVPSESTTTSTTSTTTTSTTTSTTTTSTTTSTTTMPPIIENILYGDVDEDGKVAASDASLTLIEYANLSSGNASFTEEQFTACDVNEDNKIGADDAANILMFYTYLSGGGTEKDMKKWFSMQN